MTDAGAGPAAAMTRPATARQQGLVGLGLLVVVLVAGLLWAKWLPYAQKVQGLADTRSWPGAPIFATAGDAGSTPSLHGAWSFWTTYFVAVWKAAAVALVVAALLESVVPRRWLLRVLARRTWLGQGMAGGVLALPSMMCTCCTAPVAVGLRRRGAPLHATLAYWIGNPLLNPAVVVFLALTLPWQYAAVRVGIGTALVVGGTALAVRWSRRPTAAGTPPALAAAAGDLERRVELDLEGDDEPVAWSRLPLRFARALARYLLVLVPEYAVVVLLTGWLSGWLSDFAGLGDAAGPVSLLLVGLVGAALVVPTGGEVPVIAGLLAAGASTGVAGTLLLTLPALSVPSIAMVGRALTWRAVAALTAIVVVGGVVAGLLLDLAG